MEEAFISRTVSVDAQLVECRFFKPEHDGQDYVCRYELAWPEKPVSRSIYGVDEVQAILLAMQAAHTDFLVARRDNAVEITWLGMTSLGLPLAKGLRDLDPDGHF